MTLPTVASFLAKTRKSWDPAISEDWPDTVIVPPAFHTSTLAGNATPATPRPPKDAKAQLLDRLLGIA